LNGSAWGAAAIGWIGFYVMAINVRNAAMSLNFMEVRFPGT
jgi:hypothetical protein